MTTHDHFSDDLAAYLSGDLDERAAAELRDHLEHCPACSRELGAMRGVWQSLGQVPEETPDPRARARFYDALNAFEQTLRVGRARGPGWIDSLGWMVPRHPALQFALVLAVLVVGGFIGYGLHGNGSRNEEIGELREEVRSVSRLLTVSLLRQQSASERLQGVSWSTRLADSDPEITEALLRTLGHDPNVNVRLAALDALSGNLNRPALRGELMSALEKQSSPLIQMAIVDLLVRSDLKESGDVLKQMLGKPGVDETVRKRIETALQNLNT